LLHEYKVNFDMEYNYFYKNYTYSTKLKCFMKLFCFEDRN